MKPNVLPLTSVYNLRDLGGYVGYHGRKIKKNRILRSGKFCNLSDQDAEFLKEYGLNKIVDLRSPLEIEKNPDREIAGVEHFILSLSDEDNTAGGKSNIEKSFAKYRQDQYAGFQMMCQRYHDHVFKEHAQKTIHQILELLANNRDGALLYHCSEGKDRTGIVTFFILYLLGVDLETIRRDYLYSNYLLADYRAKRDQYFKDKGENLEFRANMRILGSVSDAFLDTSLITIKREFGNLDNFVKNQLGVTPQLLATLRESYLEEE